MEELDGEDDSTAAQKLSAAELEAEVVGMVASFVGADVDPTTPLAAQGLDSLAAMELRQKLQVPARASMLHAHFPQIPLDCKPSCFGKPSAIVVVQHVWPLLLAVTAIIVEMPMRMQQANSI